MQGVSEQPTQGEDDAPAPDDAPPKGEADKRAPFLPPPDISTQEADDAAAERKANARAVGLDTAFIDALGDEFADAAPVPVGAIRNYGPGGTLHAETTADVEALELAEDSAEPIPALPLEGSRNRSLFGSKPPPPPKRDTTAEVLDKLLSSADAPPPVDPLATDGVPEFELAGDDSKAELALSSVPLDLPDDAEVPKVERGDAGIVFAAPSQGDSGKIRAVQREAPDAKDDERPAATPAAAKAPKAEKTGAEERKAAAAPAAKSGAATAPKPVESKPALPADEPPDLRRYGMLAAIAVVLLGLGWVLMRNDDSTPDAETKTAKASAAGPNAGDEPGAGDDAGNAGGDAPGGAAGGADDPSAGAAAAGGDAAADDAAAEDAAGGAGAGADEPVDATALPGDSGEAAVEASGEGADVVVVEDEDAADGGGGGGGGSPSSTAASGKRDEEKAAEDAMTAAELRALAQESLKKKRYADAYRQAGKAYRKEANDDAAALRVEAACGMKNQDAAKNALKQVDKLSTRSSLRSKCRDMGSRIGL